ncbi:hypothetical protein L6164_006163 [Bauhinia variegata]|uniref:Uncharacterized protein n=1 Tax=Bauhinia variegata TaxID=167791 RepID=A0ACB9PVN8_BAUVA|nr:hypothetical protein L6164_006163 [Bauhinia variegata]
MSNLIAIRDAGVAIDGNGSLYSPAKEKATNRGVYNGWSSLSLRRAKQLLGAAKTKLLFGLLALCFFAALTSRFSYMMGWDLHYPSSVYFPSRVGYTVLMNTWKQNSLLKQAVAHYASCRGVEAIHIVWSESEPPSENLKSYLKNTVYSKSQKVHKPNFRFHINAENNLNNRFKPIEGLKTDAVFSVDDNVIVPCPTLDFAFNVWRSASSTMVGFVPRVHLVDKEQNNVPYYRYEGWWSVWWMGTYSMVLSKAAFFHKKYLDIYTNDMHPSIQDYVSRERNCEDIAMSLLIANSTGSPPIWVKGKIYEIGASSISDLKGHSESRSKCLNDFISLYGTVPLVSTNMKAVNAWNEWLW